MKKIIILCVLIALAISAHSQYGCVTHGVLKSKNYWTYNSVDFVKEPLSMWVSGDTILDNNLGSLDFLEASASVWRQGLGDLSISEIQNLYRNAALILLEEEGQLYYGYITTSQYDIIANNGSSVYSTNGRGGWSIDDHLRPLNYCDREYLKNNGDKILVLMINKNGGVYIVWMAQCWNPTWVYLTKVKKDEPKPGEKQCCGNTYITNNYYSSGGTTTYVERQFVPQYVQALPMMSYWQPQYMYVSVSLGFYIIWDNQDHCHRKIQCGNHQGQQECNYTPENPIPPDEPGQGPNGDGNVPVGDSPLYGQNKNSQNGQKQGPKQAGVNNNSRNNASGNSNYQPVAVNSADIRNPHASGNQKVVYSSKPVPSMSGTGNYGGGGVKTPSSRPNTGSRVSSPTISPSMPAYTDKSSRGSR